MTKQITIFVTILFFTVLVSAQVEPVELGNGGKIAGKSFEEKDEKRGYEITAEYPEIVGLDSAAAQKFNSAAKSKAMTEIFEFRNSLEELEKMQEQLAEERRTGNYFEFGYSVAFANTDFISVSFGSSRYSGGAHPNSSSLSLNFDLNNGRELSISDLFLENSNYLRVISDFAITDLEKQLESPDDEWIRRGAGPDLENFKSWTLSKDGLNLTFDQYQVAAYVYGPQEVLIPFANLRNVLRVLDFEPLRYANSGNSVNICRNGLFPHDSENFSIAKIKGAKNEKIYFYDDSEDICPGNAKCKTRRYVIPGDEVIVSRTYGRYVCSWYQPSKGSETVGWILIDNLLINEADPQITKDDWVGDWKYYDNSIDIKVLKNQSALKINGNAFWKGLGDNIHIGEIDFSGTPISSKMSLGEQGEFECRVKMQRTGKFLVVSDNLNCGGVNVTFNGVYRRK
jgi:Protein of unknown function (DUF3298)/Deacetylase PdaC